MSEAADRLRRIFGRLRPRCRVCLLEDGGKGGRARIFNGPFRLGFGAECDVRLDGEPGPDVIFELEPTDGPLVIAHALTPEEFEDFVELRVDGRPVRDRVPDMGAGSCLEIVDKASRRRYSVTVDSVRHWSLQPRSLVLVIAFLALLGVVYGAYLHWTLRHAQGELSRTAVRVARAELEARRMEERLLERLEQVTEGEAGLARAVDDLTALQRASEDRIRNEFALRVEAIDARTQEGLSQLAAADTRGRERVAEQSREDLAGLRTEFSTRMVESYQHLKSLESRMLESVAKELASVEPPGERLKRVLRRARESVLFIRTTYRLKVLTTEETTEATSFGTGFLVNASGLCVTAQHVLYPWRYEKEYLLLNALGLIRVDPDSVRWSVWTAGQQVLRDPENVDSIIEESAFGSHRDERGMKLVLASEPELVETLVKAPMGVVQVSVPIAGKSDSAVFQLGNFDRDYPHLPVPETAPALDALDEVLVVGYPFSRLHNGVARAQGVRGFVRRVSERVLELDAPLHPGLSGGPVLDREGSVVGMAIAIFTSDVYGIAMQQRDLRTLLHRVRQTITREEERLKELGCDPGPVDGHFDRGTWAAYRCERKRQAGPSS